MEGKREEGTPPKASESQEEKQGKIGPGALEAWGEEVILRRTPDPLLGVWVHSLPSSMRSIPPRIEERMEELLLLAREYLEEPGSEVAEDTVTCAYELALFALEQSESRRTLIALRDGFQNAILHQFAFSAEMGRALVSLFNLVTDAFWRAYTDRLRRTIRFQIRESFTQELRLAKRIQQRLLPKVIPHIEGFDLAGRLRPAAEVGGDYWSVKYYQQDDVVTLKLADISGHGIAAAMLVAAVKFISGGFYHRAESAAWVMEKTNHVLVVETPTDILVTMVYCWLHPSQHKIDIVNAGHQPVFLYRDDQFLDIPPTGPALGLVETTYEEVKMDLRAGDLLFFCSDGVIEARGPGGPFGIKRLKDLVARYAHFSCDGLLDRIIQEVEDYVGKPHDDISMVAVKVL